MAAPVILLVCHASPAIGLGHLTRMLALARALCAARLEPSLLIFGGPLHREELRRLDHCFSTDDDTFSARVADATVATAAAAVVFDLAPQRVPDDLPELLGYLAERGIQRISVDGLLEHSTHLDLVWIPSFYLPPASRGPVGAKVRYGWGTYLIRRHTPTPSWQPGNNVLVLTGGSDVAELGQSLPRSVDATLPEGTRVHWVQGPYARPPHIPTAARLQWTVEHAPDGLGELLAQSHYVLTVFGVSLFESLQRGRPTVVFSPYGSKDELMLGAIREERVAGVAADASDAILTLARLMANEAEAQRLAQAAASRMSVDGAAALAAELRAGLPVPAF